MNVYEIIFGLIKPVVLDKEVRTIIGKLIRPNEHIYQISAIEYKPNEILISRSYITKPEFNIARNIWHCYSVDIANNMVTLRKNQELPKADYHWNVPLQRGGYKVGEIPIAEHLMDKKIIAPIKIENAGLYGHFGDPEDGLDGHRHKCSPKDLIKHGKPGLFKFPNNIPPIQPLVEVKNGIPFINDILCTYESIEVRNKMEELAKDNEFFSLPAEYTHEIMSSDRGKVTKISKM